MFSANVFGLISVTQLLIKGPSVFILMGQAVTLIYPTDFKTRNAGHVINVGSIAGRESYAGGSVYCASKAAVRAFTGSLLREVVSTPIRVTEIQPGLWCSHFSCLRLSLRSMCLTHHRNGGDRILHRTFPWRQVGGGQGIRWPTAMCVLFPSPASCSTALIVCLWDSVTAEDIAEEIVWAAARPPHVNLAEVYVLPVNQASPTLAFRDGSK